MSIQQPADPQLSWTRFLSINRLNLVLLVGLIVTFMFQAGIGQTNCGASAQTSVCQAADSVDIAGDLTLRAELQVESTPTAGTSGEVLLSQGTSAVPIWSDFFTEILKAADETVSASTVLQNDDDFSFTVETNAVYLVEFGFRISENIAGAQDFKFNFTVPSGTVFCSSAIGSAGSLENECGTNDLTIDTPDLTESLHPARVIFETAGTSGTVTMQWAQDSASNNTTLHQNSTMRLARIS